MIIASIGADAQLSPTPVARAGSAQPQNADPRLVLAIAEFHARWQADWRFSEGARRTAIGQRDRHKFYHCDVDLFKDPSDRVGLRKYWGNPEPYVMIQGRFSRFGSCPSWLLTASFVDAEDESVWRDGALLARLRPGVVRARSGLIRQLRDALAVEPNSEWISGQLVRALVEQRELEQADSVARACGSTPWWCAALGGFAAARAGRLRNADSAFRKMRHLMPNGVRQTWDDLGQWLPPDEVQAYSRIAAEARDTLQQRLWWLSDPLFRSAGNARRVEQDVRQMEVALRSATTQDERYAYDAPHGGDAVATAIRRYGWPSYTGWSGPVEERSHSRYLEVNHSSPITPPYTTFEYTTDRVRTLPSPRALATPFSATTADWNLAPDSVVAGPLTNWWPSEHFRHTRQLVQLPDGQTVAVRRQSWVEVVTALSLSPSALRRPSARYDVMLLASRGPEQVDSIDQQIANAGATVVLRGNIAHAPSLLAIEALGVDGVPVDARTRFGYTPPVPLSELRSNEIALSDLALLTRIPESLVRAPNDSLLAALLPSTTLAPSVRSITLYWESYGTVPEDSATLAVRVVTEGTPSIVQRIGIATGLVDDPSREVTIRWKDTEAQASTTTLRGPVPVQMRALSLDLAALRAGRYTVEVLMTLRDGRNATAKTLVELRP